MSDRMENAEIQLSASAAIIEAPLVIPRAAPVAHAVQKVSGVATATVWKAEIIDLAKLVAYIATPAGRQFLGLVQPNTTALNSLARERGYRRR
jgi:hypothetical protein